MNSSVSNVDWKFEVTEADLLTLLKYISQFEIKKTPFDMYREMNSSIFKNGEVGITKAFKSWLLLSEDLKQPYYKYHVKHNIQEFIKTITTIESSASDDDSSEHSATEDYFVKSDPFKKTEVTEPTLPNIGRLSLDASLTHAKASLHNKSVEALRPRSLGTADNKTNNPVNQAVNRMQVIHDTLKKQREQMEKERRQSEEESGEEVVPVIKGAISFIVKKQSPAPVLLEKEAKGKDPIVPPVTIPGQLRRPRTNFLVQSPVEKKPPLLVKPPPFKGCQSEAEPLESSNTSHAELFKKYLEENDPIEFNPNPN